jgi:DNA-binding MarR family transcriptional regulator
VTQAYDDALRPTGLRSTQFTLLSVIDAFGTVRISDLAEEAVMDRTTLTRNLRLLEEEGLIRITPGEDARVREVSLAPAARRRMTEAAGYWLEAQGRLAASLGEARVKHLLHELAGAVSAVQTA